VTWILPEGASLSFEGLAEPVLIVRGLGSGSQGQVMEVQVAGERLALKWYFPACIARDPNLERRLGEAIRATAPSASFLWPIALLRPTPGSQNQLRTRSGGFGYLMGLRPPEFAGAVEHVAGRLELSLRSVLLACLHLADAFHALHSKGLCYKDISLGNLFLEPGSGQILICDNDNVDVDGRDLGSVLGTPGFMAPEILLGRARPGATSDLHALAVLIFRLLTRHDPFRGAMELAIRCLDEPARRRLYGEDPVFIFDPLDRRNRPDPEHHAAALLTWPIYPAELQALFVQSFGPGLRDPARRALTGQWQRALARCLDQRQLCPGCGQENFRNGERVAQAAACWHCGAPLPPPPVLRVPQGEVVAAAGTTLHRHHFDPLHPPQGDAPLAELVAHPSDPAILGLRNLTRETWRAVLSHGEALEIGPGRSVNVAALAQVLTPEGPITPQRRCPPSPM
jgi:DNA-binding helix-hairpin-helix protein with protein kinase domain